MIPKCYNDLKDELEELSWRENLFMRFMMTGKLRSLKK